MYELKICAVGNSNGVILPREALARLRVEKGDKLYLVETPGGFKLTAYDERKMQQMQIAEGIMKKRRTMLKALAK